MPLWLKAIYAIWIVWGASWIAAALWADRTVRRPGFGRELRYQVFTFGGWAALLGDLYRRAPDGRIVSMLGWPAAPLWHDPDPLGWALAVAVFAAVGFGWWARLHLGRLWSAALTRKADHRVVDSGPYALVRHPIYTALLSAALATACAKATPLALLGAMLMVIGYVLKARMEEGFLRAELGAAGYDAYAARVPMLVPRLF